jgi:hypothetical protein
MTRQDLEHLAQVTHSLHSQLDNQQFDQFVDRMLWAIRSSDVANPKFDEQRFRQACKGKFGIRVFPLED